MSILNYLAGFHAVCQTLNISKAAKSLGMTQPSLSRHLKKLEDSVGAALFVRRQHGIELTEHGRKLAEAVAPVLTALSERMELIRGDTMTMRGTLKIGSLAEIGKAYVLPRVLAFSRDHAEVEIDLQLLNGDEIEAAIAQKKLDLGFVVARPTSDKVAHRAILEERSVVVTRQSHLSSLETTGDVLKAAFVAYRQDDPLLQAFLASHFPGLGRGRVKPKYAVNDHRAMIEVLTHTDVFAVMPVHSVTGHLETGALRLASKFEFLSTIYQIESKDGRVSALARAFQVFSASAH